MQTKTATLTTRPATAPAVSPASALTTALHLAEMDPEQLASASRSLLAAEERYDRMSGICATLNGLVLLEARRKITHGKFIEWVKTATGRSERDAQRRMRIAESFMESLSKSKSDTRVVFESAEQMLLEDFAAMLSAEAASPMDESNPVFAAVAEYVDGRSYRALADALPGKTAAQRVQKHLSTLTSAQIAASYREQCAKASDVLALIANRNLFAVLPDADLDTFGDNAEALLDKIRAWRKLTKAERTDALTEVLTGKL